MTHTASLDDVPPLLRLTELTPYFSVVILECTIDDPDAAFEALRRFLRRTAENRGRAVAVRISAEVLREADDRLEEVGHLGELGADGLYGVSREVTRPPSWANRESGPLDVVYELTIAVRRDRLVAVHTDITTNDRFARWMSREGAPFRSISADVMAGVFRGDGKMVWTRGTHRRRTTKADSRAQSGLRLQDALHPQDDASFALTAAKVNYQPDDKKALLRNEITFSVGKSRLAWKQTLSFPEFLAAALEAMGLLAKTLVAPDTPDALFPQLAVIETDLSRVRGAYDITVADPDQVRSEPDANEERVQRAELLRDVVTEVRGEPGSARAVVDVGRNGVVVGTLALQPVERRGGFGLDVRFAGAPSDDGATRVIRDLLAASGDLLTIYYESGHSFTAHRIAKERLIPAPFRNVEFADFNGYAITTEKPRPGQGQSMYDAIGTPGDTSLFAWVVNHFTDGLLLCHDGAGEIADFLHLANDGTLTAIHVKAAVNNTPDRHIAVTRFQEVVSQAMKNIGQLDNEMLIARLSQPRGITPRVWNDGAPGSIIDFVQQLHTRVRSDRTNVVIVQPHLLKAVHDQARAAINAGTPTRDSCSLMLLDNLLHGTHRTVTTRWDNLTVIGCA